MLEPGLLVLLWVSNDDQMGMCHRYEEATTTTAFDPSVKKGEEKDIPFVDQHQHKGESQSNG